jgi:prophage regulatory protein
MTPPTDSGSPGLDYRGGSALNPHPSPTGTGRKYLRLPAVLDRTGLKKTTIYALQRTGAFPRNYPLSTNTVGWLETEVEGWLASREKARDQQSAKSSNCAGGSRRGVTG